MDEPPRPVRRTVYIDDPPPPPTAEEITPRSNPTPVRQTPPQRLTPLSLPLKTSRFNDISPPQSHRKPPPPANPEPAPTNPPPLRLMDVIAQNRARRGARPPKPRREVDEAKVYDPPTYNRNIIKNGFIVHK